jgi:hypothetical protein
LKGEKEMDIFGNVNLQVVTHSTGIKKLTNATKITNGAAAKAVLERMAAIEEAEEIDKQALQSEKDYDAKKQTEKVVTKQINDNQKINKVSEVYHTGKNIIFKEILFEVFKKSLYLDTEFIQENWENLRSLTDSYVDSNGGIKLLEAAGKKRGCIVARGEIDYTRISSIVLDEFRGGRIGRISLELPEVDSKL